MKLKRVLTTVAVIGMFTLGGFAGCDKSEKGDVAAAGNPALLAAGLEVAKLGCACKDAEKKDWFDIKVGDKGGMALFMKSDTKSLSADQKDKFFEARSQWNNCFKPGYKKATK
ncbi:MAG: hypothetical protein ACI9MR_002747 [Myxococcota bacterium]|jgi:hypothetical protein